MRDGVILGETSFVRTQKGSFLCSSSARPTDAPVGATISTSRNAPLPMATSSLFKTSAAASPPTANGVPLCTSPKTATTPSNGLLLSRIRTARSACSVAPTSVPPRCSLPSLHPPHLAGICPVVTASNYHDGWTYQGGAFEQWFDESWTSGLAQDTLEHKIEANPDNKEEVNVLPLTAYPVIKLAPSVVDTSASAILPYFLDSLTIPTTTTIGSASPSKITSADIHVPALHIATWCDIFLGGSLRNYIGIKAKGGSEEARKGQRLLVLVGGHAGGRRENRRSRLRPGSRK